MKSEKLGEWPAVMLVGAMLLAGLGVTGVAVAEPTMARPKPTPNTAETRPTATPRLNAKQRQILKSLIGRWQLEDAEDELEFRPDGAFLGKSHSVEMTAKYQISPEGKLIIDLGLPVFRKAQPPSEGQIAPNATPTPRTLRVVREVRFEGNKLLLRDSESGQTFRYRRLR